MNIAIVGATGNVGRKLLEVIEKLNFEFSELYLIASDKSIGKKITFKNKTYSIVGLDDFDFSKVKIAFFSAGSAIAEKWAPIAAKKTIVIDNSKHFRMDKDIPLVVPEVNADNLKNYKPSNQMYNSWIQTYSGEEYQKISKTVGKLFDRAVLNRLGKNFYRTNKWKSIQKKFKKAVL